MAYALLLSVRVKHNTLVYATTLYKQNESVGGVSSLVTSTLRYTTMQLIATRNRMSSVQSCKERRSIRKLKF